MTVIGVAQDGPLAGQEIRSLGQFYRVPLVPEYWLPLGCPKDFGVIEYVFRDDGWFLCRDDRETY